MASDDKERFMDIMEELDDLPHRRSSFCINCQMSKFQREPLH